MFSQSVVAHAEMPLNGESESRSTVPSIGRHYHRGAAAIITADGRSVQSTRSHLSSIAENAHWPASPTATSTAFGRSRSAEKPARQALGYWPLPFQKRRAHREPTPLSCDLINADPPLQSVLPMEEVKVPRTRAAFIAARKGPEPDPLVVNELPREPIRACRTSSWAGLLPSTESCLMIAYASGSNSSAKPPIEAQVIARHYVSCEPLLEHPAHGIAIELIQL